MPMKLRKNAKGELFIAFDCPHCQAELKNRVEQIGSFERCAYCSGKFTVPGDEVYRAYLETQSKRRLEQSRPVPVEPQIQPEPEPVYRPRRDPSRAPEVEPRSSAVPIDLDHSDFNPGVKDQRSIADDYISMTLNPGEKVLMQFGPATAAIVALQIVTGIMVLFWLMTIIGIIVTGRNDFVNRPGLALGGTLISLIYLFAMMVLPTLIPLMMLMRRRNTITNMRIVTRSGLVSLNVNEVYNSSISGLSIRQHLFGRWFGYGTVHVYADGTHIRLTSVDQPIAVASAVRLAIASEKQN